MLLPACDDGPAPAPGDAEQLVYWTSALDAAQAAALAETAPNVLEADIAGVVDFLGLTFEPALFVVNSEGLIVDRLTHIWDKAEQDASLAALA